MNLNNYISETRIALQNQDTPRLLELINQAQSENKSEISSELCSIICKNKNVGCFFRWKLLGRLYKDSVLPTNQINEIFRSALNVQEKSFIPQSAKLLTDFTSLIEKENSAHEINAIIAQTKIEDLFGSNSPFKWILDYIPESQDIDVQSLLVRIINFLEDSYDNISIFNWDMWPEVGPFISKLTEQQIESIRYVNDPLIQDSLIPLLELIVIKRCTNQDMPNYVHTKRPVLFYDALIEHLKGFWVKGDVSDYKASLYRALKLGDSVIACRLLNLSRSDETIRDVCKSFIYENKNILDFARDYSLAHPSLAGYKNLFTRVLEETPAVFLFDGTFKFLAEDFTLCRGLDWSQYINEAIRNKADINRLIKFINQLPDGCFLLVKKDVLSCEQTWNLGPVLQTNNPDLIASVLSRVIREWTSKEKEGENSNLANSLTATMQNPVREKRYEAVETLVFYLKDYPALFNKVVHYNSAQSSGYNNAPLELARTDKKMFSIIMSALR